MSVGGKNSIYTRSEFGVLSAVGALAAFGASIGGYWKSLRRPAAVPDGTTAPPVAWAEGDRFPLAGIRSRYTRLVSLIVDPIDLAMQAREIYGDVFTINVPAIYDFTMVFDEKLYSRIMRLPVEHAGVGYVLHRVPTVGYWFPRERRGPETLQQLAVLGRQLTAEMLPVRQVETLPRNVADIVARRTAHWGDTVDLTAAIHPIVYEAIGRYFAGDKLWDRLGDRLIELYRTIADGISTVRIGLSNTPYQYLMPEYRATRKLYALLRDELPAVRPEDSPLARAIAGARLGGKPLTAADRRWMFMFVLYNALVYPGTYTYWTLADILHRPGLLDKMRAEPSQAARRAFATRCLLESIRLYPVSLLARYLDKPFEFERDGVRYHIPAGNGIAVMPGLLNKDPGRIPGDPEEYQPDRYLQDPAPRVAAFGQGPFGCVARKFTETLAASVIDELLTRFDLELLGDLPARHVRIHQTYPGSPSPARVTRSATTGILA